MTHFSHSGRRATHRVAPVQDQPVMGVLLVVVGHDLVELLLHVERRLAGRKPGAVADPEDVGVDRDGRLAERDVEHDIGGLAADAGQLLQRLARGRHLAAVIVDQLLRERDDVLGLGVEQADGLDEVAHLGLAELHHLLRCVGSGEQRGGRLVDTGVGGLRRQHHGDEQRVGIDVLKLGLRLRIGGLEASERLLDFGRRPRRRDASGGLLVGGHALPRSLDGGGLALASPGQAFPHRFADRLARCFPRHHSPILGGMTPDNDSGSRTHDLFGGADPAPVALARWGS